MTRGAWVSGHVGHTSQATTVKEVLGMTTARDIMTAGGDCAGVNDTLIQAAEKMRDLKVGALPIFGDDNLPAEKAGDLVKAILVLRRTTDHRRGRVVAVGLC